MDRAVACTDLGSGANDAVVARDGGGASWLVTPCGQRFLSLGVNALDGGYPYRDKAGKIYYSWTAFAPTERRVGGYYPRPACQLGLQ